MAKETTRQELAELVRRCQAGETAAQHDLYQRCGARVLTWAHRLAPRSMDAEDVAQEVFLSIFSSRSGYRGDAAFDTWLFRIVRNTAFRRPTLIESMTQLLGHAPREVPDDRAWERDFLLESRLLEGIKKLSVAQREALALYDLDGCSATEIADLLGVPEGTVRSRVRLARKAVRPRAIWGRSRRAPRQVGLFPQAILLGRPRFWSGSGSAMEKSDRFLRPAPQSQGDDLALPRPCLFRYESRRSPRRRM